MEMNYCRRCGSKIKSIDGHVYNCDNGHTIYANSAPAVGLFILTPENHVMLSVRGIEPHKGMLDAFGGFVDSAETFEEAISREMEEELQLTPDQYETPVYIASGTDPYPYQGEEITFVSALFWSRLKAGATPIPSDDVADTVTIPLHEVDLDKLHSGDIRIGIIELRKLFPQGDERI